MNRQLLVAAVVVLLALGGVGLLLLPEQDDPTGSAGNDGRTGSSAEDRAAGLDLPPEVLAALQGIQPPAPNVDGPLPFDPAIAALGGSPVEADAEGRAPNAGGAPVDAGMDLDAEDGEEFIVDAAELHRREKWLERQNRRDDLRAEVLENELGVAPLVAAEARAIMSDALAAKTALYGEQGDAGAAVLGPQLAEIRLLLADRLGALLGPQTYQSYQQLDESGHFVLPDEVKKPDPQ